MDHSLLCHGSADSLPEPLQLKAGGFSMFYLDGALRYISRGNEEVVRMIFPAVRDQNWGTVVPEYIREEIRHDKEGFNISLACQYRLKDIDFTAWYRITGLPEGKIVFQMKGRANSNFLKNRIGLCVLHPLKETVGKECRVIHPDGNSSSARFPFHVSPHQPVKNISALQWDLVNGSKACLEFKGDIFEMEDHRNWTDASFKTYSTPLELPFPVMVMVGESMEQEVSLTVENVTGPETADGPVVDAGNDPSSMPASIDYQSPGSALPKIGLSANQKENLTGKSLSIIGKLNIDHYRLDIRLYTDGWERQLRDKAKEIDELNVPLELVLHTSPGYENELKVLAQIVKDHAFPISHIILFQKGYNTTPNNLVKAARKIPGIPGQGIRFGGGTDAYFAELNRERPDPSLLDFVSFSINPQVHAFDILSLTETLEAQQWVVRSAKEYFGQLPVFVSPVTLKPRFNPNATSKDQDAVGDQSRGTNDPRQKSLFGAAWTLGSIKALSSVEIASGALPDIAAEATAGFIHTASAGSPATASGTPPGAPSNPTDQTASYGTKGVTPGASSITWFQTTGPGGLMDPHVNGPAEGRPLLYPVYYIFKNILEMKNGLLLPSVSSDPLKWEILAIKEGKRVKILVTSFAGSVQDIALPLPAGKYSVHYLDEDTYPVMMYDAGTVVEPRTLSPASPELARVCLKPFATAIIDGSTI
jgi:D-apionolactonase